MSSPSRWFLAASLTITFLLSVSALGQGAGRRATDDFIARIRDGTASRHRPAVDTPGWDNDAVIDALLEVLVAPDRRSSQDGSTRRMAASLLAYPRAMQKLDHAVDSRGLRFMLPARVTPVLLDALADAEQLPRTDLRENLLAALGSLDEPPSAAIAAIRTALTDPSPRVVERALVATGSLGFYAAESLPGLERMLADAEPGTWIVAGARWRGDDIRMQIAGALARVSSGVHTEALSVLMASAHHDRIASAERAIAHLRALTGRAEPVVEELMTMLRRGDVGRPVVSPAIVAISPGLLPAVLDTLTSRAAAQDMPTAWSADRELLSLALEHGDTDELRSLTPALVATLNARSSAADGLQLAKSLREIDSPEAQTAFEAFRHRERRERGAVE